MIKLASLIILLIVSILYAFNFIKTNLKHIAAPDTTDKLLVHYINVGQGDSILLQSNGKNLLIDTGSKSSKKDLFHYLEKTGIKNLDYIVATHPHEDHIGNMGYIINKYGIVENLYAPKKVSTSASYKAMISALTHADKKITVAKPGISFHLGDDVLCKIIAPNNSNYDNINNYSVVLKVTFGKTSFLFTGDAENISEKEILEKNHDINVDVLKVGHHGSKTSTSDNFLKAVSPKIAIISCGDGNEYGHPHQEIIEKLEKNNISIFRTDIEGSIVLESNGYQIIKK